jgi:hypothetical protein
MSVASELWVREGAGGGLVDESTAAQRFCWGSLTSDIAHYFLKLVLSKLLTAVIQLQVSYIQLHARFEARAELLLSCGRTHTTRLLLVL